MSNSIPLVTICIPCYNASKTISQTLDSLLAQDYPNKQILVCDNSSTDSTIEIIKLYESRGVRCIVNPTVKSGEDNWNFLLDHIPSEYFCLFHADDLYEPAMVSTQMKSLLNDSVIAVFTMSTLIDQNNKKIKPRIKSESFLPSNLKNEKVFHFNVLLNNILIHSNFIRTPTLLTTMSAIRKVGKFRNDKFKSASDFDLWLRMSQAGPIGIISERLHKYRVSESQGSFSIFSNRTEPQDYFKVIDYYLNDASTGIISNTALHFYDMYKGAELIVCSKNLLLLGRIEEGKSNLKLALTWTNFRFAVYKKKTVLKYIVGLFLFFSIYVGLGRTGSRIINLLMK